MCSHSYLMYRREEVETTAEIILQRRVVTLSI
jgi:hypothetical protein